MMLMQPVRTAIVLLGLMLVVSCPGCGKLPVSQEDIEIQQVLQDPHYRTWDQKAHRIAIIRRKYEIR